jgi:hypothetical protein
MTKGYTELQDELGLSIIGLSNEILEENLRLEIAALPRVINGRTALSVSSDARWDKLGGRRQYNSLAFWMFSHDGKSNKACYCCGGNVSGL